MFKDLIEWLLKSGTLVKTIAGAMAIIIGIFVWDARYAKTVQVANDLHAAEQKTVQTIQSLKSNIDLNQYVIRLQNNMDMIIKMKMLMKSYPNDKELKEDYESLIQEKEALQKKIKTNPSVVIIQPNK